MAAATDINIQRNDGLGEWIPISIPSPEVIAQHEGGWDAIKMRCAKQLYKTEELYCIEGAHDVKMYLLPRGEDVEADHGKERAIDMLRADSTWAVDIFGAPFTSSLDVEDRVQSQVEAAVGKLLDTAGVADRPEAVMAGRIEAPQSDVAGAPTPAPAPAPAPAHASGAGAGANAAAPAPSPPPPSPFPADVGSSAAFLRDDRHVHVATFVPELLNPERWNNAGRGARSLAKRFGGKVPGMHDYEDTLKVMARCRQFLQSWQKQGDSITLVSLHTVLLPSHYGSAESVLHDGPHVLYRGVYDAVPQEAGRAEDGGGGGALVQGVRAWFVFDQERTIVVKKKSGHVGLQPIRQEDGWIIVRALESSPCARAGMPLSAVHLTHVNGHDVSPHSCPSLVQKHLPSAQQSSQVKWETSVLPHISRSDTCTFTFF